MKRFIPTLLAGLALLGVAAGCSSTPLLTAKPTPTAAPNANGRATGESIIAEGRVTPAKSAALSFTVPGAVVQVPVKVGQRVEPGAPIAKLDDVLLQKQIAQAQAALDVAKGQQAQAQAQVTVAEKQLAAVQTGATESTVAAAKAALASAQANYARVKAGPSADDLAALKANLDNAKAAVDQAQAAYDRAGGPNNPLIALLPEALKLQQATNAYNAALATYNSARAKPAAADLAAASAAISQAQDQLARLTPSATTVDTAQAAVDAAKAGVSLAGAQVSAAQAALDAVKAQATNYTLVAPFAGTVITLDVDPGEYAAPGVPVARLADTSAWQIETTDLTELNVVNVTEGSGARMTFDAIPGLELTGKVASIKPFGETRQGDIVYTVVVTPDQQDPRLRWNMTAKVNIQSQ